MSWGHFLVNLINVCIKIQCPSERMTCCKSKDKALLIQLIFIYDGFKTRNRFTVWRETDNLRQYQWHKTYSPGLPLHTQVLLRAWHCITHDLSTFSKAISYSQGLYGTIYVPYFYKPMSTSALHPAAELTSQKVCIVNEHPKNTPDILRGVCLTHMIS